MTDEVFTNIERVIRENGYYTYRMFPTSNTKCINFMVMPLEGIEKEPAWTEPKPFSIQNQEV